MGKGSKLYPESEIENMQEPQSITIGSNTHIRGTLYVYPYGNGIQIGSDCYIGERSRIVAGNKIHIGNSVLISHDVTIIDTDSHELNYIERDLSYKNMIKYGHPNNPGNVNTAPITIEDNVWISCKVCILKGVTIGKASIIGAGSIVTKDIPPFSLAVGNPAKVIKHLDEKAKKRT
jgi:acetyltransferase-like isoleucine patch superfamily enzyme